MSLVDSLWNDHESGVRDGPVLNKSAFVLQILPHNDKFIRSTLSRLLFTPNKHLRFP